MTETIGGRELERAGFTVIKEVELKWEAPGKWFEAITPQGEEVAMLRQSAHRWHAFFKVPATASGGDPISALKGGLGDVIDTDAQLRSYCRMVLRAPLRLARYYDGLNSAGQQCYHEIHGG